MFCAMELFGRDSAPASNAARSCAVVLFGCELPFKIKIFIRKPPVYMKI